MYEIWKVAGYDRVSLEMLRGGGGVVTSLLYQLFKKCWKSHRYLMTDVKQSLYPTIKGKAHGRFAQITALKASSPSLANCMRKSLSKEL
ncbi:hypothetical protein EVAR_19659_1 [Eumeta japonica]|uniref:Uncharacterized protein n=1 Tax=Eumeta variegata TaxID=151549 RepID=A0A4C1V1W6_EUMVA|nr:hypothetical protein EVAR_19659_1 [Eumeta japonica]